MSQLRLEPCIIETLINVPASQMFRPMEDVIKSILSARYVGHCERQCLVSSVERIIRRSDVRLTHARLDGSGDISVTFGAMGYVLNPGDILVGCEITAIVNNEITCKHPHVVISVTDSFIAKYLQVGRNTLTVRVDKVAYDRGATHISATASIVFNLFRPVIYRTPLPSKVSVPEELRVILTRKLNELKQAHHRYDLAPAAIREEIHQQYCYYSERLTQAHLPKASKILNLMDLVKQLLEGTGSTLPLADSQHPGEMLLVEHMLADVSRDQLIQIDSSLINPENPKEGPPAFDFNLIPYTYVTESLPKLLARMMEQAIRFLNMISDSAHFYEANPIAYQNNEPLRKRVLSRHPEITRKK